MTYDPAHHHRSIRLRDFDYASAGAFFVTLCTQDRLCLFGHIEGGEILLSLFGRVVEEEWLRTPQVRPSVDLDAFVVMPNHVHGIIVLNDREQSGDGVAAIRAIRRIAPTGSPPGSIGAIVGQIKTVTTKRVNALRGTSGSPVWQRNYYEHVIRDDRDLARIRAYIAANPARWQEDGENPFGRMNNPRT
ncbi:MAG: transposase [Chloroflexota bacterium]|nr:transposase [Chloroflexota bacterium]